LRREEILSFTIQTLNSIRLQSSNEKTEWFCNPEHPDFINFSKNPPLKACPERSQRIRGDRSQLCPDNVGMKSPGLMKIEDVTPFVPLTLRGISKRTGSSGNWNSPVISRHAQDIRARQNNLLSSPG
jgi:hypothetical protein